MDISDIRRLDLLWAKIYPYLAAQVMSVLPKNARKLLELGPFSGGISFELSESVEDCSIVIADKEQEILDYLSHRVKERNLLGRIRLERTPLFPLKFGDREFDGVISRGAFFFLNKPILKEIHRVLKRGGIGFVGGGFGVSTPRNLIDEVALESRRLNRRLGKKWLSKAALEKMITAADLEYSVQIIEEGGLWLLLKK